jgi:hypothetical protein
MNLERNRKSVRICGLFFSCLRLPDRRLWVRGMTAGVYGPYVPAQTPVRPDSTALCDPGW